jgi:hypothetical protein
MEWESGRQQQAQCRTHQTRITNGIDQKNAPTIWEVHGVCVCVGGCYSFESIQVLHSENECPPWRPHATSTLHLTVVDRNRLAKKTV